MTGRAEQNRAEESKGESKQHCSPIKLAIALLPNFALCSTLESGGAADMAHLMTCTFCAAQPSQIVRP